MAFSPAQRRYNRRIIVLSIVYALLLFAAVAAFTHGAVTGALAVVVAVLPALPVCGFFVAIGRYLVEEGDEYLRAMFIRQQLVASGLTLCAATIWGFLENFGQAPHLAAYTWAIVWFGALGLAGCGNLLTARRAA